MHINVASSHNGIKASTHNYLERMLSPLCGINTEISFIHRARTDPRLLTISADLGGVHLLQGLPKPKKGSYHIGASDTCLENVLIRTLSESMERYAQLTAEINQLHNVVFATYNEMLKRNEPILAKEKFNYFTNEQLAQKDFPFQQFTIDQPISWIKVKSLINNQFIWVPAQLIFVGYNVKTDLGEPWLITAITSGTASHTDPVLAMRSALLELIQYDTAVGHWHTNTKALEIEFDDRTLPLQRIIEKYTKFSKIKAKYYWLPSPDFPGMNVACTLTQDNSPGILIGLSTDTELINAMYKAYLEAVSGISLSKFVLFDLKLEEAGKLIDLKSIYDLDTNFGFYAQGGNAELINKKFNRAKKIKASQLPEDLKDNQLTHIKLLIDSFRKTSKELVYIDLTTPEAKQLGFVISRVWSPDTLTLSFPSTPSLQHYRFTDYGGVTHDAPHPYP